jgi:hypothetical protein
MTTNSFSSIYRSFFVSSALVLLLASCAKENVKPETPHKYEIPSRLVTDQKYDGPITTANQAGGSEINPNKKMVYNEVAPNLHPKTFNEVVSDQKQDVIETRTDVTLPVSKFLIEKNQDLPISTDQIHKSDLRKKELMSSPK